jgi:hypothetical protein
MYHPFKKYTRSMYAKKEIVNAAHRNATCGEALSNKYCHLLPQFLTVEASSIFDNGRLDYRKKILAIFDGSTCESELSSKTIIACF